MKILLFLLVWVPAFPAFCQDWPVKKQVQDKKARQAVFISMPAFSFNADKALAERGTFQQLRLDAGFQLQLLQQRPEAIQLTVPISSSESIICDLVQFSLGNIKFTENNTGIIDHVTIPLTYRGIVAGVQQRNNVTLTVNKDYLSLVITLPDKVIQVIKDTEENNGLYRLYNSSKIQFPTAPVDCGTKNRPYTRTRNGIELNGTIRNPAAVGDKCVNVFVECFDSLYINRSSNRQQTINFVYELFNSVATGYFNEQINIQITTINVWTTMDPYRGDNRDNALADLANNYKDNFWGNICVGLDFSTIPNGRSGVAGAIGRVKSVSTNTCPAYTVEDHPFCYNDMNYPVTVANFPVGPSTNGPQVYLVMHEMGHLLGARHTKWCGWKLTSNPDTFGAIDSCGTVEGSCMQGPPPPASGATIMSYCVTGNTGSDFVNYNNGFGLLPGNAIRNFVEQSTCIMNCLDCFGLRTNTSNETLAHRPPPTHLQPVTASRTVPVLIHSKK